MIDQIGIDTLKIWLPDFGLKDKKSINLLQSSDPERNKRQTVFSNGETYSYEKAEWIKKDGPPFIVNFKTNGLTASVSVPKVSGKSNIELMDCKANKKAYEFIFDTLNDSGVLFNAAAAQNSRIDITRNLDLLHSVSEYYPLMSMIPHEKENFQIGSTKYQRNRSFALCAYDKLLECKEKKQPVPAGYEGKNIGRLELRLLKGGKLRTDSKKAGVNLLDLNTMTDPDKFLKVQNGLYIGYLQHLFRYDFQTIAEQEKAKLIQQLKFFYDSGLTPLKSLAYTSYAFNLFSVDEIAYIFYPDTKKAAKQKRYKFKRRYSDTMKKLNEESKETAVKVFNAMYQEIREKALKAAA
jgi:hypothetical protein